MNGNRFRVPSSNPRQRAATAFPASATWDAPPNRPSCSARGPNEHETTAPSLQRPSSRFVTTTPSYFINDEDDDHSDVPAKTSIGSHASSDSFDQVACLPMSPHSKPASIDKEDEDEKMDEPHSPVYGSESQDFFGESMMQIEGVMDFLTKSSRYAETLEEGIEGAQSAMQRQHSALLREQEMTSKLTSTTQDLRTVLDHSQKAERDASAKLEAVGEAMKSSLSECEQLRTESERLRRKIKELSDQFAGEKSAYVETQKNLDQKVQSLEGKVGSQEELLAQKDQAVHEVTQELAYVQRRIEDEIGARKKVSTERDELFCQVAELQELVNAEKNRTLSIERKNSSDVEKLERACKEQSERDKCCINQLRRENQRQAEANKLHVEHVGQLQLENEKHIKKNNQLMTSANDYSQRNSMLCQEITAFNDTVVKMGGFLLKFLEAVKPCRDAHQDIDISSLGIVLGDGSCATFFESDGLGVDGVATDGRGCSMASQKLKLFSNRLEHSLIEAAVRETSMALCFAKSKTAHRALRKAHGEATEMRNSIRASIQQLGGELSACSMELHGMKDTVCRIHKETEKWQKQSNEGIALQKTKTENVCLDLNSTTQSLARSQAQVAELQDSISGHVSAIKELQEALAGTKDENVKSLGEMDACRKMLEDNRNQLEEHEKVSETRINEIQANLQSEIRAKENVIRELADCKADLGRIKKELDARTEAAQSKHAAVELEFARISNEKAEVYSEMESMKERLRAVVTERDDVMAKLAKGQTALKAAEERLKGFAEKVKCQPKASQDSALIRSADACPTEKSQDREHSVVEAAQTKGPQDPIPPAMSDAAEVANVAVTTPALPKKRQQVKATTKSTKSKRTKVRKTLRGNGSTHLTNFKEGNSALKTFDNANRSSLCEDEEDWLWNCDE